MFKKFFQRGNSKKILMSMLVVGMISSIIGAGTFASFSAQTYNNGNTFTTGTLVLSNQVTRTSDGSTSLTKCYSANNTATTGNTDQAGTGDNTYVCDVAFNPSNQLFNNQTFTATLTLKNEGTLNASDFLVFMNDCSSASSGGYTGNGELCDKINLYIQLVNADDTDGDCLYPAGTGSCVFNNANTLTAFETDYTANNDGLDVASTLNAGVSQKIRIGLKLQDVDNDYQGRTATFDFRWYIAQ